MDIVSELCAVPEADARKKIAVIQIDSTLAQDQIMLADRPLWLWSVQYSRNEGFQPIIYSQNDAIRQLCLDLGVTYSQADTLQQLLQSYPSDFCAILDPHFPIRPKGLLRNMGILMHQEPLIPVRKAITGGMACYDSYVLARIPSLVDMDAAPVQSPEVCDTKLTTQEEAVELETKLKGRHMRVFDPWFLPKCIAVVLSNIKLTAPKTIETINSCDLIVELTGSSDHIDLGISPDIVFPMRNQEDSSQFPLAYSIYPEAKMGRNVAEMSCILAKNNIALKLNDFTAILSWIHLTYPESKIIYYANPNLQSVRVTFNGKYAIARSFSSILETNIWESIANDSAFQFAGKELTPQEAPKTNNAVFSDAYICNPDNIADMHIIHARHASWTSRLIISKQVNRGIRLGSNDKFNCLEYNDNYISISWDRWGTEYFVRTQGSNIWVSSSKEEIEELKTKLASA